LAASVLAVELQDDLHRVAGELTARCGLNDKVHHMVRLITGERNFTTDRVFAIYV